MTEVSDYQAILSAWTLLRNTSIPDNPASQKRWNKINTDARILAIRKLESGAWLHALPPSAIGTLLNNGVFRISVGLRLGSCKKIAEAKKFVMEFCND